MNTVQTPLARLPLIVVLIALLAAPAWAFQPPPKATDTPPAAAPATIPNTPAGKVLVRVLKMFEGDDEAIGEADLDESFKQQVPIETLRKVTAQLRAAEGSLTLDSIKDGATDHSLVANVTGSKKQTALKILVVLDGKDKIVGLLIQPGVDKRVPPLKSWDDLKERCGTAAEKAAFGVYEIVGNRIETPEGKPRTTASLRTHVPHNSDEPLAIGSAFKLWVLGAIGEAIEAGESRWDAPIKVQDALKSLPSGVTQNDSDGKEIPLRTLAERMISISDNTATDLLIHRVGRERCERFMGQSLPDHGALNTPFLTTRDLFVLKLSGGDDLPNRYIAAGTDERRALLASGGDVGKGTPQIILAAAGAAPRFIDHLEWFASAEDIAKTMLLLDDLSRRSGLEPIREIISMNPGIPIDKKTFPYVGFKGGSEPGVLSLNWLLERHDRRRFVFTITFNDTKKAIDENRCIALASRAIEFLGTWDTKKEGPDNSRAPAPPSAPAGDK